MGESSVTSEIGPRFLDFRVLAPPASLGLVGTSRAIERLRETIRLVARSDRPVLVIGPTGSGKELVVRAIHAQGAHADAPLVDVNCGAIPEPLMESFLFGHERGAFTGATRRQEGSLSVAGRGTLFLDEIAELPLTLQPKLLRVLESRRFAPVGSSLVKHFAGRVVAATHAALEERAATHRFREDLLYRLNVLRVVVPGLDERVDDIPALVDHFCRQQARPLRLPPDAIDVLCGARWPGNVRQLRNVIDRLAVFADGDVVTPDLLCRLLALDAPPEPKHEKNDGIDTLLDAVLRLSVDNKLEAVADALIAHAMGVCGGNKSAVARLLGVHRKAIERRLDKSAKPLRE
ncbi:MAG TPA: sigma-54 dependent transcriptional regulator [Polyangia bacterium]|nr:sigma-54 dependent transcriptional regulator [Polyangia bacterium]